MLFLRGLRWRRGFSAAVLVVGILSAAVAAIGPLYARASSESTLTDELRSAGSGTGMAFDATADLADTHAFAQVEKTIGSASRVPGYAAPIHGESTLITAIQAKDQFSTPSIMVWRDQQCAHLVLTAGHCPTAAGQALVPDETLHAAPGWVVGQELTVRQGLVAPDGVVDGPVIGHARIVGGYRPRDFAEAYWFDRPYFQADLGPAVTSATRIGADAIFVEPGQFGYPPPKQDDDELPPEKQVDIDVPLTPGAVRLSGVSALRARVAAVERRFPTERSLSGTSMRTELTKALADAARDKRQVETATLVVVLELAALSLLVLFQVVGGSVEARGDEIALAKLRGLRPRRTVLFALGEPVTLLLVAAPLGFLLALAATRLLAAGALVGGTPVAVTSTTWLAVAAAFSGSALAAGLAAVKTVTRPVLEQWRNTAPARHGARLLLALDLVLAAVAIGTLVALRAGNADRPRAVFLLAPALLVFAVALVGIRLLPRVGRLALPRTRATRRIAFFLALRQTVRRPGGLRLAAMLAVAAGLATFAICGEAVARSNRDARAQTEVGTTRQLTVQFETAHDPQSVVDAVDPRGRWAMATATWVSDGGPSSGSTIIGRLMGVEADRLGATTYRVRGQLSPRQIESDISSSAPRSATFRGTQLRVVLDTSDVQGDHPVVELNVRAAHALPTPVAAGSLRLGTHAYTARVACADGCAVSGLTFDRTIDAQDQVSGSTRMLSIESGSNDTFRPVPIRLNDPAAWRADEVGVGATVTATAAGSALAISFQSTGGSSPVLSYADSPTALPVVATPKSTATDDRSGGVSDYTGAKLAYQVRRRASPLPVVLDTGAIANLDYLRIRLPNFDRESTWSVWLGPHAPSDATARLERAGLIVQNTHTTSARVAELGREGPALGLLLLVVCAIASAVLAVGGTAVALLADARRRSFELAALHVVGVPTRTLRRSAVVEQLLLLGAAILLGLPSGYLAAALVLPVVPEFSDPTPVVLRYSPPILLALACAAAFGLLLWGTALVAGRALARAAVPARLREAAR